MSYNWIPYVKVTLDVKNLSENGFHENYTFQESKIY